MSTWRHDDAECDRRDVVPRNRSSSTSRACATTNIDQMTHSAYFSAPSSFAMTHEIIDLKFVPTPPPPPPPSRRPRAASSSAAADDEDEESDDDDDEEEDDNDEAASSSSEDDADDDDARAAGSTAGGSGDAAGGRGSRGVGGCDLGWAAVATSSAGRGGARFARRPRPNTASRCDGYGYGDYILFGGEAARPHPPLTRGTHTVPSSFARLLQARRPQRAARLRDARGPLGHGAPMASSRDTACDAA